MWIYRFQPYSQASFNAGYSFAHFDNESLGRREHLGEFTGEFVRGDIVDADSLYLALEGIDAVVHLAADTRVVDSIEKPRFNFDVNVVGSLNLLEAMRARGVKRLVNASTGGAIIGHAAGPVNERMVAAPLAPYGASKLAVEGYCNAYSECFGIKSASLRFSNVFGPRSIHKGSVIAAFFKAILGGQALQIFGDGTQVRDYVFVGDICDGIGAALQSTACGPIQLGSGRPTTLNDLVDMLKSVTKQSLKVNFNAPRLGEIHSTYCDIGHAKELLGFNPSQDLQGGLHATWTWFLARA